MNKDIVFFQLSFEIKLIYYITTHFISGIFHNTHLSGASFEIKFVYPAKKKKLKNQKIVPVIQVKVTKYIQHVGY